MTPNPALTLRDLMFQLSRRYCYDDWYEGTEYMLWNIVTGEADAKSYSTGISDEEAARLKQLHAESGVWWMLIDDELVCIERDEWINLLQEPEPEAAE